MYPTKLSVAKTAELIEPMLLLRQPQRRFLDMRNVLIITEYAMRYGDIKTKVKS